MKKLSASLALFFAFLLCEPQADAFSPALVLRGRGRLTPAEAARQPLPTAFTSKPVDGRGASSARQMTSSAFGFGENFFGEERFSLPDLDESWLKLNKIFVLIFNPRSDNEGIYTLQVRAKDGKLINTVVFFEEEEDAIRYAGLLEAQDFPSPHIEPLDPREIKGFADESGYLTTFIRAGTLFFPPEAVKDPRELLMQLSENGKGGGEGAKQKQKERDQEDGIDYDAMRSRLEALYGKDHL